MSETSTQLSPTFAEQLARQGFPVNDITADVARYERRDDRFGVPAEEIIMRWGSLSRRVAREGLFNEDRDVLMPLLAVALGEVLEPARKSKTVEGLPDIQVIEIARRTNISAGKVLQLLTKYPVNIRLNGQEFQSQVILPDIPNSELTLTDARRYGLNPKRTARASRMFWWTPRGKTVMKSILQDSKVDAKIRSEATKRALISFVPTQIDLSSDETSDTPYSEPPLEQRVQNTMRILQQFNLAESGDFDPIIEEKVRASLENEGVLELLQFTCPRIDATQLSSDQPESYFLTDTNGNNFSTTLPRLRKIINSLQQAGIKAKINIVIGDTDEEEYLSPIVNGSRLNSSRIEQRRQEYARNLQRELQRVMPCDFTLYSWSELVPMIEGITLPISPSSTAIQEEVERMRNIFLTGNYYEGLSCPSDEVLRQIVQLKFASYARQGFLLGDLFPNTILLQSELPPKLRTAMINGASESTGVKITALYPYGQSDSPY